MYQHGPKEDQDHSQLARPREYYRSKIIFKILQLL